MRFTRAAVSLVVAGLGIATGYLARANRRLEEALAHASTERCVPTSSDPTAVSREASRFVWPVRAFGSDPAGADGAGTERPTAPDEQNAAPVPAPASREAQIRALLARGEDETADDYRARVVPVVEAALARPREAFASRLRALEQDADVTAEQQAALDVALEDARQEAILFANTAIQAGQLTADRRDWRGLLAFGGGVATILDSAQERIDGVLTPSQQEVFTTARFDWAEYLGVSTPWERLEPPPPSSQLAE